MCSSAPLGSLQMSSNEHKAFCSVMPWRNAKWQQQRTEHGFQWQPGCWGTATLQWLLFMLVMWQNWPNPCDYNSSEAGGQTHLFLKSCVFTCTSLNFLTMVYTICFTSPSGQLCFTQITLPTINPLKTILLKHFLTNTAWLPTLCFGRWRIGQAGYLF